MAKNDNYYSNIDTHLGSVFRDPTASSSPAIPKDATVVKQPATIDWSPLLEKDNLGKTGTRLGGGMSGNAAKFDLATALASQDLSEGISGMDRTDENFQRLAQQYYQYLGGEEGGVDFNRTFGLPSSNTAAGQLFEGIDAIGSFLDNNVYNPIGKGIDFAFDNTVGNLAGIVGGEELGDKVKNWKTGEDLAWIPSAAIDIGTWLLPGGNVAKAVGLGAKGLVDFRKNFEQGFSGRDQNTGQELNGYQQAANILAGGLGTALGMFPGAGVLKGIERGSMAKGLKNHSDEVVKKAEDVLSKIDRPERGFKPKKTSTTEGLLDYYGTKDKRYQFPRWLQNDEAYKNAQGIPWQEAHLPHEFPKQGSPYREPWHDISELGRSYRNPEGKELFEKFSNSPWPVSPGKAQIEAGGKGLYGRALENAPKSFKEFGERVNPVTRGREAWQKVLDSSAKKKAKNAVNGAEENLKKAKDVLKEAENAGDEALVGEAKQAVTKMTEALEEAKAAYSNLPGKDPKALKDALGDIKNTKAVPKMGYGPDILRNTGLNMLNLGLQSSAALGSESENIVSDTMNQILNDPLSLIGIGAMGGMPKFWNTRMRNAGFSPLARSSFQADMIAKMIQDANSGQRMLDENDLILLNLLLSGQNPKEAAQTFSTYQEKKNGSSNEEEEEAEENGS